MERKTVYNKNTQRISNSAINFKAAFEAMPGYSVLVATDAPVYTILAATNGFLLHSNKTRENTIGKGLFEAFPANPEKADFTGDVNLHNSFQKAIVSKQADVFSHRYDIPTAEGSFTKSYWRATNQPVLNEAGDVLYIIYTAEDITHEIKAQQKEETIKGLQQAYNLFMQAPMAIHIIKGNDLIIDFANPPTLQLWGRGEEILGKPLLEAFPEIKNQGVEELLHQVRESEQLYEAYESSIQLNRWGKQEQVLVNFTFQPYYENGGTKAVGVLVVATEITDKMVIKNQLKIKEISLQQSEQRFRAAIDAIQGILWTNNAAGEMDGEQPGWASLTGQTYEEYKGYGWSKVVHPDDAQPTIDAWNKAVQQRKTFVFQHRVKIKDGSWRTFSIRAIPLLNEDDTIREWVGVHTDVTEQLNAARALEQSEKDFRQLANGLPQLIWTTDSKGVQLFVSKRWTDFTGFLHIDEIAFRNIVHPDDYNILMNAWAKSLASGKTFKAEVRYKSKSGTYHWFYINGEPIRNAKGDIEKWVGACIDINDRKIAEENLQLTSNRFRLLADALPMFVWTTDALGNVTYINEAESNYTGLTLEQIKNSDWLDMIHPDDYNNNLTQWTHALQTGEHFECERRIRRKDGLYRWRLTRAVPQHNADGTIQSWLGAGTDIHELRELDEQKDYFIAMVSHELKTPLTSIKGYVQILQLKYAGNTNVLLSNALNTVNKQISKTTKLISDLLDVSKIKSGSLSFNKELFAINKLVQEIVDETKHISPSYQFRFLPETDALVCADRERIGQVLTNILNNAVKYSPNAKEINITTRQIESYIAVSIEDFGIGIGENDQKKIFDRFYRVEGNNENKFAGFGIGLFIVSEIIQKHGGKMVVHSSLGKGSVFSFYLPFERLLQ